MAPRPAAWCDLVIPAGRQTRFWVVPRCPWCGRRHTHGAGAHGGNPFDRLGERAAHCRGARDRAYILQSRVLFGLNIRDRARAEGAEALYWADYTALLAKAGGLASLDSDRAPDGMIWPWEAQQPICPVRRRPPPIWTPADPPLPRPRPRPVYGQRPRLSVLTAADLEVSDATPEPQAGEAR